jgi:hypothetical protein
MVLSNDVLPREVLRHGAYLCLPVPDGARAVLAAATVEDLADRLGFRNEFDAQDGHPPLAVAFLRRVDATRGAIVDEPLLAADAIVHVAAAEAGPVEAFCDEAARLLAPLRPRSLAGVVKPPSFTGGAMHEFAYARQVTQQPGPVAPHAFLLPLVKTAEWWAKDWMERHTYLLPRYDDAGRMTSEGHALAASAGVPCLMRRTYKDATEPAPDGSYDFLTYFECADADVPTFHAVCASLRDAARNPEWRFVREGPLWHGRRVRRFTDLFD